MNGRAWTNKEKEVIRTEYRGNLASVKLISQKVNHPISSIKGQIYRLGLGRRIDYKLWTQEEEEQLADLITRLPVHKITKIMGRSVNSIAIHAYKLRMSPRARDGYFTQRDLCLLLGVDHHWIRHRITRGELEATPNDKPIPAHGGGFWRISEKEVKRFIIANARILTGRNIDLEVLIYIMLGE